MTKSFFWIVVVCAVLSQGCGTGAPQVTPRSSSERENSKQQNNAGVPREGMSTVVMDLSPSGESPWGYWKAGTNEMVYNASPEFTSSREWDMRIKKLIPKIGSNGGKTAEDEGYPDGRAAFAAVPDSWGVFVPTHIAQIQSLAFQGDTFDAIESGGMKLGADYQNMVVNTMDRGWAKNYNHLKYTVELTHRIFILRAANGADYYAIHFRSYSRSAAKLEFEWRKLQ